MKYHEVPADSIVRPRPIPLDIDKLPGRPFSIHDFQPLKQPLTYKLLDLSQIPDSALIMDTAKDKPFLPRKYLLPKPVIVKAGTPKVLPNVTSGILQFSEEEGLPGSRVSSTLVDKNGVVWMSTEKGLCRYNGDYLQVYSLLNKTLQGIDFNITDMVNDKAGNIWALTDGDGIYIINPDGGYFLHYPTNIYSVSIICDHEGKIWLGSFAKGFYIIDLESATIRNYRKYPGNSIKNTIVSILEDKQHNVWITDNDSSDFSTYRIDASRKSLKKLNKLAGLPDGPAIGLTEDKAGNIWTRYFQKSITVISQQKKTIGFLGAEQGLTSMPWSIAEDDRNQLWIGSNDSLFILDHNRANIKKIVTKGRIANSYVSLLMNDGKGNIWMPTQDKGVLLLDANGPRAEHLGKADGLVDDNIWGLFEDSKGAIWIGTYNGLNIYDPVRKNIRTLNKQNGLQSNNVRRFAGGNDDLLFIINDQGFTLLDRKQKILTNYGTAQKLDDFFFMKCMYEPDHSIWISSIKGVVHYDLVKNSFKVYDQSTGLSRGLVWDLVKDRMGNYWAGTDSGITVIDPVAETCRYLTTAEGLCDNIIQKMIMTDNGNIWVGTRNGFSVVDPLKMTITNLSPANGLYPGTIYDMALLNGTIYAGSSDGLIKVVQPDSVNGRSMGWRFMNYGKREGFPRSDFNQNTGVATSTGQTWWGITPVMTVITQEPGIDTIQPEVHISAVGIMGNNLSFFSNAAVGANLKDNDSIGAPDRSAFFHKGNLPADSGVWNNGKIQWDSLEGPYRIPAGLVLPFNQNSFNFSFVNNDIKSRDKVVYRYVLEGVDQQWRESTTKSISDNYFNLEPGSYRFLVCTAGGNGIWSEPAAFSFTIVPPWWKRWWAYLLYSLLAAFILREYSRYKSRQLRQENLDLENKVNERTAKLSQSIDELKATQNQLIQAEKMASLGELTAGIAHEIQNPLNFVNNFSEVNRELIAEMKTEIGKGNFNEVKSIADDIEGNEEKIIHHGRRADAIVKGMLQHSRSSNNIKEPTDINALADEYLRLSYHGLRAKDNHFNATMETDFDPSIGKVNIVPQDIGRVLLNLYNNAFYAVSAVAKPTVTIRTKNRGSFIEIEVSDNGGGIPAHLMGKIFQPFFTTKPSGQGTGLGLSLSYDIITKGHGGELKVESSEGVGTRFIIQIPIKAS